MRRCLVSTSLAAAVLAALALVVRPAHAGDAPPHDERGGNVFFRDPDRETDKIIQELVGRFAEDSPLARRDARRQLEEIGYWSVEPLHVALAEREAPIRAAAALTLGAILDPRSVAPLRAAVYRDTSTQFVSGFAAIGLARFRDPGAVEPLRTALRSSKSIPTLRAAAPFALARIGTPEAKTVLLERLKSRGGPEWVKSARLLALGFFPDAAMEPDRPEPSAALREGLRSNRREIRRAALLAFLVGSLHRLDTRDVLLDVIAGEDTPQVLIPALLGLSRFEGTETTRVLAERASRGGDDLVRVAACDLLAPRADVAALDALRSIFRRPSNARLRASALVALGPIDHEDAAAAVLGAFDDKSPLVRAAAAVAAVRMPSATARDEALRRIQSRLRAGESSRDVRHDLEEARAVLTGERPLAAWREVGPEHLFLPLFRPYEEKLLREVNLAVDWALDLSKIKNLQTDAEISSAVDIEAAAADDGTDGDGNEGDAPPPPATSPSDDPGSRTNPLGDKGPAVGAPRTSNHQELRDLKIELLRRPLFALEDLPRP